MCEWQVKTRPEITQIYERDAPLPSFYRFTCHGAYRTLLNNSLKQCFYSSFFVVYFTMLSISRTNKN
jgi:hypothetical protein